MLCELGKQEGLANFIEVKLQGKVVEKMTNEVIKGLPDSGMFECTYECPVEKEKPDARK